MLPDDEPQAESPPFVCRLAPSRATERHHWQRDALSELEDLGDLWGLDLAAMRLR